MTDMFSWIACLKKSQQMEHPMEVEEMKWDHAYRDTAQTVSYQQL